MSLVTNSISDLSCVWIGFAVGDTGTHICMSTKQLRLQTERWNQDRCVFLWAGCTGFWTQCFFSSYSSLCIFFYLFLIWETDLSGVTWSQTEKVRPFPSLNSIMCASLCAPPCSFQWNCFAPADFIFSRKTGRQSNGSSAFWCRTTLSHVPHVMATHCLVFLTFLNTLDHVDLKCWSTGFILFWLYHKFH